jgi:hypothetical protein
MVSEDDPTADELEGLAWWRGLSETARTYWLEIAKGTVANPSPADAWAASKRVAARESSRHQTSPDDPAEGKP